MADFPLAPPIRPPSHSVASVSATTEMVQADRFYLYAAKDDGAELTASTVFCEVEGESLAKSLLKLFTKEYGNRQGAPRFDLKSASAITTEDQFFWTTPSTAASRYVDPETVKHKQPPRNTSADERIRLPCQTLGGTIEKASRCRVRRFTPQGRCTPRGSPPHTHATVDEQTFTVTFKGKSYQFTQRGKLLFALFTADQPTSRPPGAV